jgi:hypothetical protein
MPFVPDADQSAGQASPPPGASIGKFVPDVKQPAIQQASTGNSNIDKFKTDYASAAAKAGKELNVDPSLILAQWGHETGWGKSIIPGTNNLGNIKGKGGVEATDNQLGTKDTYAKYKDNEEFVNKYVDLIKSRYPSAMGAGKDAGKFTSGLKGYAEDKEYAKKVSAAAGRVGEVSQAEELKSQDTTKKTAPSGPIVDGGEKKPDGMLIATAKNLVAGADIIASTPGAMLGPLASATGRWVAIAQGAQGEDISKFGSEFGNKISENLSSPIHKMLDVLGVDFSYTESGVSKAMGKVSEAVGKGAEYVQKKSGGVLTKEDAQDLTNAVALLAAPASINMASKALLGAGRAAKAIGTAGKPVEEAVLREVDSGAPSAPAAKSTPVSLAKQHIEETTGISKMKEETPQYKEQRRADARAAFPEDPQYAEYLKSHSDMAAVAKDTPNVVGMQKIELQEAGKAARGEVVEKPVVTYQDALPILKKPGFERTAEDLIKLKAFNSQRGSVEPEMLAKMATIGIGVTAGLALDPDHKLEGALLGAAGGYAVAKIGFKAGDSVKTVKEFFGPDKRIRINDFADHWESSIGKASRSIYQDVSKVMDKAKTPESRTKITNWIQGDKSIKLTEAEYQAAKDGREFFNNMGKEGLASGVLTHLIPDYVTNLWDLEGSNKAVWTKTTSNMSPKSKFDLQRKISSLKEGKEMGLKPVTEDLAVIMGMYGNSLSRTMANKQLIDTLKSTKVGENSLLASSGEAPKNYVPVDHPQLQGQMVHPDIAKSMQFMFSRKAPHGIIAGLEGVNTAVKRLNVSLSLFHAKSLADAFVGAGGNPLRIPGMATGANKFLKQIREGGAGDIVDKAYEGGLMFTLPKGGLAVEDVGGSFYKTMEGLHKISNDIVPGLGVLVKGFEHLNHAVDTIMWERLHAGMKLNIFSDSFEKLKQNNIDANAKDSTVPLKTDKQLSGIAASYANDLFGGLNWRRAAEETKTVFARDIALSIASPTGRRAMQMLMFAPDWTISTTRAAVKAFGKGSGLKGLIKPQELADLHRQYLLRSAAYYFTVGNALNYALSGHSILQNKDKTQLELGDGRTIQFSKHMMEPVHWITKPGQQALNKLGAFPQEAIEQASNTEYLSTKGSPPMAPGVSGHARHMLKKLVPIVAQGRDLQSNVAGFAGFPISGRTEDQKEEDKETAREQRRKLKEEKEDSE